MTVIDPSRGAHPGVVRELNRTSVLDALKRGGHLSRADLAKVTTLTKPTVSSIISDLLDAGLVTELGRNQPSGRGRPATLIEFNAGVAYGVGVQIGNSWTRVVVADSLGREQSRAELPTPRGATAVLSLATTLIEAALVEVGITSDEIAGIGVCLPGLVDLATGVCRFAPTLGWRDVAVADALHQVFRVPVHVHDATQAATVAEAIEGKAIGYDNVVVFDYGERVAAGLLLNGRLFHGATGLAGALSHTPVPGVREICACGRTGCLESVASAAAIIRTVQRAVGTGQRSLVTELVGGDLASLTAADVADAAREGDAVAKAAMDSAAHFAVAAAAWMVDVFNPQLLVLGGPLGMIPEWGARFGRMVRERAMPEAVEHLEIAVSDLGVDAWVRGAVLLALQRSQRHLRIAFDI